MNKKASPKYYIYAESEGKNGRFVETTYEEKKYVIEEDPLKTAYLKTNPFLYNPKKAQFPIFSIEDFLIKVGKEEMAFGDAIRNTEFSLPKRRRIVKKAFRTWNKSYSIAKTATFSESDKMVEVIGEVSGLKFSWKLKLLLCCLFVVTLFLNEINSYLWKSFTLTGFGNYFQNVLMNMYSENVWLKIVGNLTVYIILFTIFFSSIYSLISKDFSRNYRLAQKYLDSSERSISRSYNKRWKNARRYYLKALRNSKRPYFPPLDIEEIQEGELNIDVFKQICQVLVERAYKYKKSKPVLNVLRNVLMFISIVGSGTILIFTVIHMVLSIF
ncbi:MAG: hypothetical protein ACOX43_02890 [Bacilli bacterium]